MTISKRFPIAIFAAFLFIFARGPALAQDRAESILSAGAEYRTITVSDAVTTWLEHSTVVPCWELLYRLRIPSVNDILVEISAGLSYYESNTWFENGALLDEGMMRIFLLEAPISIGSTIPLLGPWLLTGDLQAVPSYRELG